MMRASQVTQRRSRGIAEEKKDDTVVSLASPPSGGLPGTTSRTRRRRKSKERRSSRPIVQSLVFLAIIVVVTVFYVLGLSTTHDSARQATTATSSNHYLRWLGTAHLLGGNDFIPSPPVPRVGSIFMTAHGLGAIRSPGPNRMHEDSSEDGPFYGHLNHHTDFGQPVEQREILWSRDESYFHKYAPEDPVDWYEWRQHYFAFDDDVQNSPIWDWEDGEKEAPERPCRKVAHHRVQFPTCNNFHEVDLPDKTLQNDIRFIGAGAYRDVFTFTPEVVLKVAEINMDYDPEGYECMRMEGAVYSLLTPHPLIVDTYGFCALSIFNEAMMEGDVEDPAGPIYVREECDKAPDLRGPELVTHMNNLTATQKLEWSLTMAEALSVLHYYKDGLIIHDDVQLPQFMRTKDGGLKLGDFNRAEFPKYDEKNGEYCKYRNNPGHGDWRAPEEYFDEPLDEKIDVWSVANNMYVLLTGVYPFYELCETDRVKSLVKHGKTVFVDPRWANHSYAEGILAKIIEPCFAWNPEDRPTMADLVRQLREAVAENRRRGNT